MCYNMKKFLVLLPFLFILISGATQDVVVLKHTNYTSHYSKSKKYPVMVEWWVTRAKVGCPTPMARKDNFKPDPLLSAETDLAKDYVGSGTDRGHMMPAAENLCQGPDVQNDCFYFSNMAAQYHSLNAGDWKSVETMEREWAKKEDSVHVWCGNLGVAKTIGAGKVAVPKQCWKVIYFVKSKEWMAFLFDNDTSKPDGIHNNLVDVIDIEKLTGFKFKK
jgi:endonuclease G